MICWLFHKWKLTKYRVIGSGLYHDSRLEVCERCGKSRYFNFNTWEVVIPKKKADRFLDLAKKHHLYKTTCGIAGKLNEVCY
jgi:hypothetical protein